MSHVAIVLPGANYGPDKPGLAVPIDILRAHGARIVVVKYPETRDEILDALAPQIAPAIVSADRVTVVAKSLGTSVIGSVSGLFPSATEAIWITPLFGDAEVRADVLAHRWPCLSVFGTADSSHDPVAQAEVTEASGGVELAIEGADHGLIVDGDDTATRAGYESLRRAVEAFLG